MFPWSDGEHKAHVYVTEVKNVPRPSWSLPKKYVPDYKKYGREEIWLLNKDGYEFRWFGYVRMFRLNMMIGTAFWHFKRGGEGYFSFGVDPTQVFDPGCAREYVKQETRRQLESRKFIRETRETLKHDLKPKVARAMDDIIMAEQVKSGKKPYRVPLSKF